MVGYFPDDEEQEIEGVKQKEYACCIYKVSCVLSGLSDEIALFNNIYIFMAEISMFKGLYSMV